MGFLCRIGLHHWLAQNLHVKREMDGVWFDVTQNRCARPDCPKHLWWSTVDIEVAYWQIPFDAIRGDSLPGRSI